MSGDPRDYHRPSRNELPPLRDVVGDALDNPARSPYRFDFRDVDYALPGPQKHASFPSRHYLPERGPTLPPIRHISSRDYSPSPRYEGCPVRSPGPGSLRDGSQGTPEASTIYTYSTPTTPQPPTGPAPYSFNVLRAQQGDLVDVRTPSSRAQGILRPTAIIEDEDESHKRYKCTWPGCEKKYDRPSSLEVHRHTHTGHQPFPCQYPGCKRAFNVKSNMLRHFRSHPQGLRSAGKQKSGHDASNDQPSDEEDDENWPESPPSSRYFHNVSSSTLRPLSSTHGSSASTSSSATTSSHQYYTSSRRH